jgi:AraC family transcriptional regulator
LEEGEMTSPSPGPFSVFETHGRAVRPENELLAHSEDVGWRSLHAAIFKEAPIDLTEPALGHPFIIYHLTHPTEVTRKIEGARREKGLLGPRNICITPPETMTQWEHHGHPEILQVYLRRSLYEAAVGEMYGCDATAAEIVPRFGIVDPLLEQLSIALADALRSGAVRDGLYIDTVAHMMAVHLARAHSVQSRPAMLPYTPAMSHQRMRQLIEFIEANLDQPLTLDAMASQVGISPLYLARAFKAAVGQSPHQYVLARRIERAKELLRNTEIPIIDVALSVGFSSQSHLSHWMIRQTGVSPAVYRRSG